jgi:hypothetical protein
MDYNGYFSTCGGGRTILYETHCSYLRSDKNGGNYGFNLGSVEIVAELILQLLSVAEEVRQQYQRALASSHSHPRLDVIQEHMPPRCDGDARDDKGGCKKKPRSRSNRKNKNANTDPIRNLSTGKNLAFSKSSVIPIHF